MFSNILTTAYGTTPHLSTVRDGGAGLPCSDTIWNAPTEEIWRERMSQHNTPRRVSLRNAVFQIMGCTGDLGDSGGTQVSWSPYAAVIVMHGVSVQIWHSAQNTQTVGTSLPSSKARRDLQSLVADQNAIALSRCYEHVLRARDPHGVPWTDAEGPLFFNCCWILRLCHLRAFADTDILGIALLEAGAPKVTKAIRSFRSTPQPRDRYVIKAMEQIFEGIIFPSKVGGRLLIQKTAALTWSIEIAIYGGLGCKMT